MPCSETISLPHPMHRYMPWRGVSTLGLCSSSKDSKLFFFRYFSYLYHAISFLYDYCRLAHRAFAAIEAAALRSSSVMLAARRFPPILPPLRPIWAMSCDTTDLVSLGSSGLGCPFGFSPVSLLTAIIPAWNSSSGALRERFCIRYQLGTIRRLASRLWKFKVAHYPAFLS